ncbi:MAG: T9SS type A sorting domain-containing protein [Vicingaceae bacterium]
MKNFTHYSNRLILLAMLFSFGHLSTKANVDTVLVGPNNSNTFSPANFTMNLGDTVLWIWSSGTHTTTSTSSIPNGATSWDIPITSTSTSFMYVPAVEGSYNYDCTPHAAVMKGTFRVVCGLDTTVAQNSDTLTAVSSQGSYHWVNCDSNYTGNAADTNQRFIPTQSGNYALIISNGNCADTSSCYNVTITSVIERKLSKPLQLAPNPATHELELINFRASSIQQLNVYNISGQVVFNESGGQHTNAKVDVSHLVNGVYFIEVLTEDERYLSKFIKK